MKAMNREKVLKSIEHFEKDLREYGIFLLDASSEENRYCKMCKFGEWPRPDFARPNNCSFLTCGPQLNVAFSHTEDCGSDSEWGNHPEGVLFWVDEGLVEPYRGRSMILGAGLLSVVADWGFDHGRFLHRSDAHGLYPGPHEKYPDLPRPHGIVSKHFLVRPEIYEK